MLLQSFLIASIFIVTQALTQNVNLGEIHGNFETIGQAYIEDTIIGAAKPPEGAAMNAFSATSRHSKAFGSRWTR